ncbi:MAG: GIY-YIG nuclease family protein [Vicinamibacterales bacterium]
MPHFIYILECSDHTYYVGYASDPALRLEYHQSGRGGAYTAKRLLVKLVFQESHPSQSAALAREKQVKRWSHVKKAALIAGDSDALHAQARRKGFRPQDAD